MYRMTATRRRRTKVSITVDPQLLHAVDVYVQKRTGLDRSKVMETALKDWYRARQDEAMEEQFSGPEFRDPDELRSWRAIRRAAAAKTLRRPAS
jgi:hypothetical protein